MKSRDLAEFHNVHERTTRKWSQEQRHRKTIQAEADVTPLEWQLVGEIAQLCYLYNAQNWHGTSVIKWVWLEVSAFGLNLSFFVTGNVEAERLIEAKVSNTAEMQLIKMQLEKLVYGDKEDGITRS